MASTRRRGLPPRLRAAAGARSRAGALRRRGRGCDGGAVIVDFAEARKRRIFRDVAGDRAASVVRRVIEYVAPDRGSALALARPWPDARLDARVTLVVLQMWLDELREWEQSLAGLDPWLLRPLVAALREAGEDLRRAPRAQQLGAARLAAMLRSAADTLDDEASRLARA